MSINMLLSLHKGYGLGDAVQMSAVMRHVAKYRQATGQWVTDLQAEAGRFCIGRGILNGECYEYGKNPNPDRHYDAELTIFLYDTWANWHHKPNTRVSSCLWQHFGLEWDAECGRYQINVGDDAVRSARTMLYPQECRGRLEKDAGIKGAVALHYEGVSSQERKNLTHHQAKAILDAVERMHRIPVVLDWAQRCPLEGYHRLRTPKAWGGDAEMVCAVISQCAAFVGIDSGPSKCASATDTPALVVWTGHHPAPFHDPAPNTTHLVPRGYHGLHPVCDDPGVIAWFEAHHRVRVYDRDPVGEVVAWLEEVLA